MSQKNKNLKTDRKNMADHCYDFRGREVFLETQKAKKTQS